MLKKLAKHAVSAAVKNDLFWRIVNGTIVNAVRYAERERRRYIHSPEDDLIRAAIQQVCSDLVVKNGVFKGLRYPSATSYCSTIFPKLLGSYERELHPLFEQICQHDYSEVLDIGCAEGYYAVGLAVRMQNVRVYAYDIDSSARQACQEMARINGVAERVQICGRIDSSGLEAVKLGHRALVISDCEGFEEHLFSGDVPRNLASHDVLIETHDFLNPEISEILRQRFEATHSVVTIASVDDVKKAKTYDFEELRPYSLAQRRLLLAEKRPAIMEWLYFSPKSKT